MIGREEQSAKLELVGIPSDLNGLVQHIGRHLKWTPKEATKMLLVMGACMVANETQITCVQADLVEYIERHGHELGIQHGFDTPCPN